MTLSSSKRLFAIMALALALTGCKSALVTRSAGETPRAGSSSAPAAQSYAHEA